MVRRFLIFLLVFFPLHQFVWAQQKAGQSLEEVFAKTLEHHPLLMIGEKGVKLASEKTRINQQLKLPEISVLAGMDYMSDTRIFDKRLNHYSNLSNIHFGNSLSAEISQVIYNGGKIRYNIVESEWNCNNKMDT
ncbi:TolC family protein [Sphingobacterium sp. N143]|uniref:TolC family protein n=1 Tax=Sphingobacterium sp. N143 TaxID=2746727 RepID=UPI0025749321|nr:TolC family protein [Sphingobacterium sp. N143]MDM1295366.1 TolC family protein [Sphingobacterium sp. N143]